MVYENTTRLQRTNSLSLAILSDLCRMKTVIGLVLSLLTATAAVASDPLAPGTGSSVRLRNVGLAFSGRSPGGVTATTTLALAKGLSLDAGLAASRVPDGQTLNTIGMPVILYGELGRTDIFRLGIGWHWAPLKNDGMPLLSLGYQALDIREDLTFSVDVTLTPDIRFISQPNYWWTVVGLMIGVPL